MKKFALFHRQPGGQGNAGDVAETRSALRGARVSERALEPDVFLASGARDGDGGLMYAGGYPLYENFRDLCLPGDFHAMFESAPGR